MFESERSFKFWDYLVSHNQLLLRSPASNAHSVNVDVVFWGVKKIQLPTILPSVYLRQVGLDGSGTKKFLLSPDSSDNFVEAVGVNILENQLDLFDSSLHSPNASNDRDVGVVIASG